MMCCSFDPNWVIAFAAVASLVVTYFLLNATKRTAAIASRTADIASETLRLSYEPILSLEAKSLVEFQSGVFIEIELTNGGGGPAVIKEMSSTEVVGGTLAQPQTHAFEAIVISKASKKLLIPVWDKSVWSQRRITRVEFKIMVDIVYQDISRVDHRSHVTARLDYDSDQFIDEVSR